MWHGVDMLRQKYLQGLSPPIRKTYHYSSRIMAGVVIVAWCMLPLLLFIFTSKKMALLLCIASWIATVIVMRDELIVFLRGAMWLEFGPEGVGGIRLGGVIPWRNIGDVSVQSYLVPGEGGPPEYATFLVVSFFSEDRIRPSSSKEKKVCHRRISLDRIDGPSPAEVYRELLKTYTYYSEVISERMIFPYSYKRGKKAAFIFIAACVLFVGYFFTESFFMQKVVLVLIASLGVWLLVMFSKIFLGHFQEEPIWLQFGPEGISGDAVKMVIPWSEVQDLDVKTRIDGHAVLVLHLVHSDMSNHLDGRINGNVSTRELRLDPNIVKPNIVRVYRDALMAFARYSNVEATKNIAERIEKLFS
jgi:hypothetical protein